MNKPTHVSGHSYKNNPNHEQINHNKNEAVYAIESFALSQRRSCTVARFADVNQYFQLSTNDLCQRDASIASSANIDYVLEKKEYTLQFIKGLNSNNHLLLRPFIN